MGKLTEYIVSILIIFGLAYIFYDVLFLKKYNQALLYKKGIKTTAVFYNMGGTDVSTQCIYHFYLDRKEYKGSFPSGANLSAKKGDTIDILYLPTNPEINAIPEEVSTPFTIRLSKWVD